MKKNFSKLLALYLPYLLLGLTATNFGEAWRLAEGKEMGDKILSLMSTIPAAFANPLPSLHPLDILASLYSFTAVSYRLFPSASITTMAGKSLTVSLRIASVPRSS